MKKVSRDDSIRVFISATSADLSSVRDVIYKALRVKHHVPIEQDDFAPDYRSVSDMLTEKISGCDVMIHVVGMHYGAEPDLDGLPDSATRQSYTQMEAQIANTLNKRLYIFICPEDFPYDPSPEESEEKQKLQREYRASIRSKFRNKIRNKLTDLDDTRNRIRDLNLEVESLREKIIRLQRYLMTAFVLAIGVIAIVIGVVLSQAELDPSPPPSEASERFFAVEVTGASGAFPIAQVSIDLLKQLVETRLKVSEMDGTLTVELAPPEGIRFGDTFGYQKASAFVVFEGNPAFEPFQVTEEFAVNGDELTPDGSTYESEALRELSALIATELQKRIQ